LEVIDSTENDQFGFKLLSNFMISLGQTD